MYRNWKNMAALGLAVLLGCMMPMSTILAVEEDAEIGVSSVSDNDAAGTGDSVSGNDPADTQPPEIIDTGDGTIYPEEPPKTDNVISESGEYALKAGEKYHLAEGKWKVGGDKSVYPGGRDFYVTVDGSYRFSK